MTGGDAYPGDITEHRLAGTLFQMWHTGSARTRSGLASLRPPGPIALRCRYLHLIDTARTGATVPPVPPELWRRALVAETEIDDALRRGDFDDARRRCAELAGDGGFDDVTVVNALIGLGDADRATNRVEQAIEHYEAAVVRADAAGYRFGRLRALIPLGHLTLAHDTAVRAGELFAAATALADDLDDPVYRANAVQGAAACAAQAGDADRAIARYGEAYDLFAKVRTATGQAHTAQRLGELYHRRGRPAQARDWLVRAAEAFADDGDPVGMVNVLENLGDLLLDADDPDGAETQYRAAHAIAAEHGLPLARAHAEQNFGRVALDRGAHSAAVTRVEQSMAANRELGDPLGVCFARTRRAETCERLGGDEAAAEALRHRVAAVFAIEEYRAANRRADAQREYRARFAGLYARALRAAVAAGAPEDFVVVADGLAGRRLAGLASTDIPSGVTDNLTLLQHLLVSADQRWIARTRPPGSGGMELPEGIARQERVRRMLGATAIGGAVREPAREAVEDLLAAAYLPPADDGPDLLACLPPGCHTLLLVRDPEEPRSLHRLWYDDQKTARLETVELSESCDGLLALLQTNSDERSALRPAGLTAFAELLPDPLRDAAARERVPRLLLVPVGDLWLVPWGAVPLDDTVMLGQAAEYVVCPSLTVQRVLRERGPARAADRPPAMWRSPLMEHLGSLATPGDERGGLEELPDALRAKARLSEGAHTVVLFCHGRLAEGPGHYLELDADTWLLPADVLTGVPPQRLYLITCWGGGIPGQAMTEPVTIATLTLSRGTTEVLATVGEFEEELGDQFAQWVFEELGTAGTPAGRAVHRAARRFLAHPGAGEIPVRSWAPLLPIGTFHD